jgi:hypothetical protein
MTCSFKHDKTHAGVVSDAYNDAPEITFPTQTALRCMVTTNESKAAAKAFSATGQPDTSKKCVSEK